MSTNIDRRCEGLLKALPHLIRDRSSPTHEANVGHTQPIICRRSAMNFVVGGAGRPHLRPTADFELKILKSQIYPETPSATGEAKNPGHDITSTTRSLGAQMCALCALCCCGC